MAVHEIIRMGHPTLRRVARQVDPAWIGSHEFDALIEDMQDTLNAAGGIGLAQSLLESMMERERT